MDNSAPSRLLIGGTLAAVIGLVAWLAFVASAPRYSYGAEQDMGEQACTTGYFWAQRSLSASRAPSHAAILGAILGLPGLVLSPWTAPRGDNDGLAAIDRSDPR